MPDLLRVAARPLQSRSEPGPRPGRRAHLPAIGFSPSPPVGRCTGRSINVGRNHAQRTAERPGNIGDDAPPQPSTRERPRRRCEEKPSETALPYRFLLRAGGSIGPPNGIWGSLSVLLSSISDCNAIMHPASSANRFDRPVRKSITSPKRQLVRWRTTRNLALCALGPQPPATSEVRI